MQPAVRHAQLMRAARRQRRLVRDQEQCHAPLALDPKQQLDDLAPGVLIEVAGRLVGEQTASGWLLSARASATRCCSPPDSWPG